jgi:hypothetical protein
MEIWAKAAERIKEWDKFEREAAARNKKRGKFQEMK